MSVEIHVCSQDMFCLLWYIRSSTLAKDGLHPLNVQRGLQVPELGPDGYRKGQKGTFWNSRRAWSSSHRYQSSRTVALTTSQQLLSRKARLSPHCNRNPAFPRHGTCHLTWSSSGSVRLTGKVRVSSHGVAQRHPQINIIP